MSIAIFCAIAVILAVELRVYSAHKDSVASRYAKRVPVAVQQLKMKGVENAGKISNSLYRGAQPRDECREEFKLLLETRSSLILRNSKPVKHDDGETREQVKVEPRECATSKFPQAHFWPDRKSGRHVFATAARQRTTNFFSHCYFGDDRTGVMVATYSIAVDRWTSDEAYNEMRASREPTVPPVYLCGWSLVSP